MNPAPPSADLHDMRHGGGFPRDGNRLAKTIRYRRRGTARN
ncbi:hypothetical protein [Streptomyces mirabilis]